MIGTRPSVFAWVLSDARSAGFEPFLERHADAASVAYYGSGKAALYDGLRDLVDPGRNVLLPAYLPDAVAEPFADLGLEPRYYRIRESLAPDVGDLKRRLDAETAAVVSVDYFGFPQPGLDDLRTLVDAYDCYHIDDNAHAPLSVDDGTLLGTRGHLGITSLRKLLPVPNGAVCYRNDETVADRADPSPLAGVDDRFRLADLRFVCGSIALDALETNATLRRTADAVADRLGSASVPDPNARYVAGKAPMSKLSAFVVERIDPDAIRAARRTNYRAWRSVFEARSDVDVLYESLPEGICPQVFPLRASAPRRLLATLERCGVSADTWPRLPASVRDDPSYDVANRLARELVALPVHQHVRPASIDAVGARLR